MLQPVGLLQLANLCNQICQVAFFTAKLSQIWRFSKAFGSENYCLALSLEKYLATVFLTSSPFPQIDIIRAMVIVWRVSNRENYQVCSVQYCVQQYCALCNAHTYEQT